MNRKPLIIGVSGGTGSGKTRFAKELLLRCDPNEVIYISQDSYYKNLKHLSYEDRCNINFDDPNSIDFRDLENDLIHLIDGKDVEIPIYNFKTHLRMEETNQLKSKPIIILEGIFALHDNQIRNLIDIKVFVDTPSDIRILRRVKRDINKRARSIESIITQYMESVRPMHEKFVEPSKKYADIIIMDGGKNKMAIDTINNRLLPLIEKRINVNT